MKLKHFSELALARELCTILSPHRLPLFLERNHKELVNVEIDPTVYSSTLSFFLDYQAVSFLKKFPSLRTGIDTEAVAFQKFESAEKACLETNIFFERRARGLINFRSRVESVFLRAQSKIADILGDVPSLDRLSFAFGPGASYGVRGDTSPYNKLVAEPTCQFNLLPMLPDLLGEMPGWFQDDTAQVIPVAGSELAFVPKNAKTDRAICIEPCLNVVLQKGIGAFIRQRLRKHGVDLDDQGINQRLAHTASLASVNHGCENLCTIDLSAASDTIAYQLILELLPIDWVEFLDSCRSPVTSYKEVPIKLQKWSSMGNGYTFELETLIFYALASSAMIEEGVMPRTQRNIHVYGDDIIVPVAAFSLLEEVLRCVGFSLNREKTFVTGSFFESCGSDYYAGEAVRPVFLKTRTQDLPGIFYAINSVTQIIRRLVAFNCHGSDDDHVRVRVCQLLADLRRTYVTRIPRRLRAFGPWSDSDGYSSSTSHSSGNDIPDKWIASSFDSVCPPLFNKQRGWSGFRVACYRRKPVKQTLPSVLMGTAYPLYRVMVSNGQPSDGVGINSTADLTRQQIPGHIHDYPLRGRTTIQKGYECVFGWVEPLPPSYSYMFVTDLAL